MPKSMPRPDEQGREGDRDRVQLLDHDEAERGRDDEAGEGGDDHPADELAGAQRQPQEQHDRADDDAVVDARILRERRELLVGHCHRAGQTHPQAVLRVDLEVLGDVADQLGRLVAGFQRVEVQHRLDDHELHLVGDAGLAVGQQLLPRQPRRLARRHLLQRGVDPPHGLLEILELGVPGLHAAGAEGENPHHAAQRRVGGERPEQPLLLGQSFEGLVELRLGHQQQPVLVEERPAIGTIDGLDQVLVGSEGLGEVGGRLLGLLGRLPVDHRHDRVGALGEGLLVIDLVLTPRLLRVDQPLDIGVDSEQVRPDSGTRDRDERREGDHDPPIPHRERDETFDHEHPACSPRTRSRRARLLLSGSTGHGGRRRRGLSGPRADHPVLRSDARGVREAPHRPIRPHNTPARAAHARYGPLRRHPPRPMQQATPCVVAKGLSKDGDARLQRDRPGAVLARTHVR